MKKIILFAAAALIAMNSFAQELAPVLDKTFNAFDTTWSQTKKVELSNKLGLIAKKYDKDWQASYYAGLSKVQLTYQEQDASKKEALLDEAEGYLSTAVTLLGKDNDETYIVKAMIAQARMAVDPQNRWQKYGPIFKENLEKAKELNADNPRIYLQKGISVLFTPEAFGGGGKAAMPILEKAKALYDKQPGKDIMKPYWGKGNTEWAIGQASGTKTENKQ